MRRPPSPVTCHHNRRPPLARERTNLARCRLFQRAGAFSEVRGSNLPRPGAALGDRGGACLRTSSRGGPYTRVLTVLIPKPRLARHKAVAKLERRIEWFG